MNDEWHGRTALVTGASRGIGAALAVLLAGHGVRMILTGRDGAALQEVAAGCEQAGGAAARTVIADLVSDEFDTRLGSVVDGLDRLDLLANVAGSALRGAPLEELTDQDWQDHLNLNLLSAVRLQQRCFPALRAAGGTVVNVGSVVASRATVRGAAYAAAKAALASLTRSTAVEWAKHGIRAICVEPGFVDTEFNAQLRAAGLEERLLAKVPTQRSIAPETVAQLIVDVASPRIPDLTGTVVTLDGGWSAKL